VVALEASAVAPVSENRRGALLPACADTEWSSDGVLRFEYTVPQRVCVGPRGTMPLGAVVALVDEVTTWASMGSDRQFRPGVSISLEAALIDADRPPQAGDVLVFAAQVDKCGRAIGFQSCEVLDAASGRRIAHGQHTKMLDMGRAWSLLSGPLFGPLLPLTERLADTLSSPRPMPIIDATDAEGLAALLRPTHCEAAHEPEAGCGTARARYTCVEEHLQETNIMFGGTHAGRS
jgi:acyl-coenzyme A thioesterase PaaI-like protein